MTERYYYYISDSKVDMLLPQLPAKVRHEIAAEIEINVAVLKAKLGSKRLVLDDRVGRVRAVEKYLRRKQRLGGDASEPWFAGTMTGKSVVLLQAPEAIFFWGEFEGQRVLLAGSARHLLGGEESEQVSLPVSFLPRLIHTLLKITEGREEGEKLVGFHADLGRETRVGSDGRDRMWETVAELFAHEAFALPDEQLEFAARRLMAVKARDEEIVLGTPLFVAAKDHT